ncbi:type VI secretion system protein TssA [Hylemonella sp. W303a]|uniref:type VI secretion system protein TssA n=1 Tax=Hylemonella sp. W303a TaxID=3389873 RepID=UPI00396AF664
MQAKMTPTPDQAELLSRAQRYFQQSVGVDLDELLQPITPDSPAGKSVRGNGVYNAIREARREDDASLPQGAWAYELKQAEWDKVTDIAAHALLSKTKDLQLAAWLMEAQIAQHGFEAIAPCMLFIAALCDRYWNELYPRIDEGDEEYRVNVLRWINEKLLPPLRLLPITDARSGRSYCWADYEQARRTEQARAKQSRPAAQAAAADGVTLQELQTALSSTPTEHHLERYRVLADALAGVDAATQTLETLWGDAAPSLNSLAGLLEQIQALLAGELYKRGVRLNAVAAQVAAAPSAGDGAGSGGSGPDDASDGQGGDGPIRNRADAYRRLALIADYLAALEPHSPVPYLLQRAGEWGNMNTAELYHEMFVRFGGNLNIFEVLGVEAATKGAASS